MIILTTSNQPQTFSCIPRNSAYTTMQITDEMANKTVSVAFSSAVNNGYVNIITATFNLVEGRSYMLVLKNGSNIIYRDKVYCTNNPLTNFSVNYNQYTPNVTNNEFIVI